MPAFTCFDSDRLPRGFLLTFKTIDFDHVKLHKRPRALLLSSTLIIQVFEAELFPNSLRFRLCCQTNVKKQRRYARIQLISPSGGYTHWHSKGIIDWRSCQLHHARKKELKFQENEFNLSFLHFNLCQRRRICHSIFFGAHRGDLDAKLFLNICWRTWEWNF